MKTGKIIIAKASDPQDIFALQKIYKETFLSYTLPSLKKVMKEGERGIIYGDRGKFRIGHVFNVIKKDGELLYVDGQNGLNAELRDGYEGFKYLKTN